jgi:hypothetical protein
MVKDICMLEHPHPYGVCKLAWVILTYYLYISSFICEFESGTLQSERPLIAKQVDQSNNVINPQQDLGYLIQICCTQTIFKNQTKKFLLFYIQNMLLQYVWARVL